MTGTTDHDWHDRDEYPIGDAGHSVPEEKGRELIPEIEAFFEELATP